jgi:hypothetical protein
MRQSLHIFCEGLTEVGYFTAFRTKARYISGGNALAKVRESILQKVNITSPADQYWIVLDKDETPNIEFDQAITLAENNGINVAWSNQAFELWIIHHFRQLFHTCHRNDYTEILQHYLQEYDPAKKGEKQGRWFYDQTRHLVDTALVNARKSKETFPLDNRPSECESATTVHILVQAIQTNSGRTP